VLNESKIWSVCELALDVLTPVTNDLPPGEPGVQADQTRVIRSRRSEELVRADIALVLTRGKVPVGQRKGVVARQSLQWTETH